ncbi:permease-like cell division protein FtsX [Actinomadura hibisca]|uniref:permease-like cell division protein FtsX n=1 Tax=Actinomadura hibisca TaxID=68565 RepID=UPI00082CEBAA|nr:permease-like cell division protein FtsX [Actinomadura hibisca]
MRAQFVFQEIWIGLRRNLTMTISLVITVAIAMALFGTGLLIKAQVDKSQSFWNDKVEVSIFLCAKTSSNQNCARKDVSDPEKTELKKLLDGRPEVSKVVYEDRDTAYKRFQQRFASSPAFVSSTKVGDIPDSFRIRLKDPKEFEKVAEVVRGKPGVDAVVNEQDILKKFFGILDGLQWAALLIAFIQVVAAVLLVGNTVRLSAFNRRRETGIMRLVGASNLYIQMPFILEGAIAGLIGGMFAAVLLVGSKIYLIDQLRESVGFALELGWGSVFGIIIFSICVGVLLCAGASFLTLRRYLKV